MSPKTWLFTPGDDPRKLRKALELGADAVIADWEDAVESSRKSAARQVTTEVLGKRPQGPHRLGIRINPTDSADFEDDLAAVLVIRPDFVVIAKASETTAFARLERMELPLVPLIESAAALEDAKAIASGSRRIERLGFGALDYCADIRAKWTPDGDALHYARSRLVTVSRAAGIAPPIDGVFPALEDYDGLRKDTAKARLLGFRGKFVVHPSQIACVNEEFTPSADAVARARRILAAYERAHEGARAVVEVDGDLIDSATLRWSQQVLEDAEQA